ncbi:oxidoreductase [Paracoccus kondratievae]|uniref:2'-hydroxyisoflavone reductase n=3 Tax=Pseudomonadota TaxID=1224 RepID=A0A0G3BAB1_9RHOB|nr:aromatic alcohol reductase [Paracoccus kondratievae]AKJ20454.1 2'-hydroxyisoflavone reductase [Paracoccus kondratievae]PTD18847.1 aromatic alcohol reductase [Sphingomonas fennica]GLK65257.1 oxidoreductase [Paracoccus kondratievae]
MENGKVDLRDMLVLGAGQLGMAVLRALAPKVRAAGQPLTALVAPQTVDSPTEQDETSLEELRALGVEVIGFDLSSEEDALAELFSRYRTVLNCTGFVAGPGTQLRITRAVMKAGVKRYFPWQFGVDYDIVGRGSGQPVFDEQYEVRQLLRSQQDVEWVIVQTGMFTSFLFEPAFDVVNLDRGTIHGLGSWETKVTVTTPEDVGKLTTEILMTEPRIANEVVFVAGDTISYGHLADVVERVTGRTFQKEAWTLDKLRADLAVAPEDVMTRYRAAFALGDGMWWDKANTFNARKGLKVIEVEAYLRARLGR